MKRILMFILTISLSLSLLFTSLEVYSYSLNGFMKFFEKYDIDQETGKSFEELEEISQGLIGYLKLEGGDELIKPYFNEREVRHMADVQKLFKQGKLIRDLSFLVTVLILFYFFLKKDIKYCLDSLVNGLNRNWIFLIVIVLMVVVDFNRFFVYFHHLVFDNNLWLLDPETDLMIQMLPEEFFITIVVKTVLTFIISVIGVQIIAKIISSNMERTA